MKKIRKINKFLIINRMMKILITFTINKKGRCLKNKIKLSNVYKFLKNFIVIYAKY